MMKLKVKKASCHVEFDYMLSGSVLKGTVKTTWKGVSTRLDIDSEEPAAKIAALVRNAKGGCFAEWTLRNPVNVESTLEHNGEAVPLK